jgi:hypothetical protein
MPLKPALESRSPRMIHESTATTISPMPLRAATTDACPRPRARPRVAANEKLQATPPAHATALRVTARSLKTCRGAASAGSPSFIRTIATP